MNDEKLEKSKENYRAGYYEFKLGEGMEYQDFVTSILYREGIVIIGYMTQSYQEKYGENILGAEIKRDGKFRETGNLYIEIAEKRDPSNIEYVPSGIYRDDNTWLYIIGDEKTIYIFSVKYLRMLDKKYVHPEPSPTSKGFLLPLSAAEKYCLKKIIVEKEK